MIAEKSTYPPGLLLHSPSILHIQGSYVDFLNMMYDNIVERIEHGNVKIIVLSPDLEYKSNDADIIWLRAKIQEFIKRRRRISRNEFKFVEEMGVWVTVAIDVETGAVYLNKRGLPFILSYNMDNDIMKSACDKGYVVVGA